MPGNLSDEIKRILRLANIATRRTFEDLSSMDLLLVTTRVRSLKSKHGNLQ